MHAPSSKKYKRGIKFWSKFCISTQQSHQSRFDRDALVTHIQISWSSVKVSNWQNVTSTLEWTKLLGLTLKLIASEIATTWKKKFKLFQESQQVHWWRRMRGGRNWNKRGLHDVWWKGKLEVWADYTGVQTHVGQDTTKHMTPHVFCFESNHLCFLSKVQPASGKIMHKTDSFQWYIQSIKFSDKVVTNVEVEKVDYIKR